jgi:hypothetical protein
MEILGPEIPDAGPLFLALLAVHVLAGLVCVASGTLAATARKRAGRHPRAGDVYLVGLAVVALTAAGMAVIRWEHSAYLFAVAVVLTALGALGWFARPSRRPARWRWHAIGMAGSFIVLLTGFYVDNGPQLPLWSLLPPVALWLIPAVVGAPLTWVALRRYRAGASR